MLTDPMRPGQGLFLKCPELRSCHLGRMVNVDGLHVHTWSTGGSIYNFSMHRELQLGKEEGKGGGGLM